MTPIPRPSCTCSRRLRPLGLPVQFMASPLGCMTDTTPSSKWLGAPRPCSYTALMGEPLAPRPGSRTHPGRAFDLPLLSPSTCLWLSSRVHLATVPGCSCCRSCCRHACTAHPSTPLRLRALEGVTHICPPPPLKEELYGSCQIPGSTGSAVSWLLLGPGCNDKCDTKGCFSDLS